MWQIIKTVVSIVLLTCLATTLTAQSNTPHWPESGSDYRVKYIDQIRFSELSPSGGFFKKLVRFIGGGVESDVISLPFDIVAVDGSLFVICQNIPALVEINREDNTFKLHTDDDHPFEYPVSLCHAGDGVIYVTDTKTNSVYRYANGEVKLFVSSGLVRPTGITALRSAGLIVISDTGDQNVKLIDSVGNIVRVISSTVDSISLFNYPTFATTISDQQILINDALNYQIKRFDIDGNLIGSFGAEGDGPGRFARPKGIATDSDNHIYVVDNMADNVQIFDTTGRVLLEFGSSGSEAGQFWSPAGIDINNDTIYIADTFNDRIQILFYKGEQQ